MVMVGMGEAVGAPRLAGIDAPPGITVDLSQPYKPPGQQGGYQQQTTGMGYSPQMTGGSPGYQSSQQNQGGFPSINQAELSKYQGMFRQTDRDGDGRALGGECFTLFMNWGLSRDVLKKIWGLVAGNQGFLNQQQFVAALYLMDCAKKGIPLPPSLPQGQFPPIGDDSATGNQAGNLPNLPGRREFQPSNKAAKKSEIPSFDNLLLDNLNVNERNKLMGEKKEAEEKEEQLFQMEEKKVDNREMTEFYNKALQELVLFKSKTDAQINFLQERADRELNEAEGAKKRYDLVFKGAEEKFKETEGLREAVQKRTEMRVEFEQKLKLLHQDIREIESMTPEENMRKQRDLEALMDRVKKAEAHKAKLVTQETSRKRLKETLQEKLSTLEDSKDDLEFEVRELRKQVRSLRERLQDSMRGGFVDDLKSIGNEINQLYATLANAAGQVGINIQPPNLQDSQAVDSFGQEGTYETQPQPQQQQQQQQQQQPPQQFGTPMDTSFPAPNDFGQPPVAQFPQPVAQQPPLQTQQVGGFQQFSQPPPQQPPQQGLNSQFDMTFAGKGNFQQPPQLSAPAVSQSPPDVGNLLNTQPAPPQQDQGFGQAFQQNPPPPQAPATGGGFGDGFDAFNNGSSFPQSQPQTQLQQPNQFNQAGSLGAPNVGNQLQLGASSSVTPPAQNQNKGQFGFDGGYELPQSKPPTQNPGLSPRQPGQLRIAANTYKTGQPVTSQTQPRLRIDSGNTASVLASPGKGFNYRDNTGGGDRQPFGSKNKLGPQSVGQSMPNFSNSVGRAKQQQQQAQLQQQYGLQNGQDTNGNGLNMTVPGQRSQSQQSQQQAQPQQSGPSSSGQYISQGTGKIQGFGTAPPAQPEKVKGGSRLKKMLSMSKNK